jgi:enoyl-CoA hydratase
LIDDPVLVERRGAVALLTLNRPGRRNAINFALSKSFCEAVAEAQDARCIVVTGADPAFCAGLDLKELGVDTLAELPSYAEALARSAVPLIAAVNGAAVTGGFEIALGCDFIVASERAVFADTHMRVGVYPGPVLVDLPRRVGMAFARERCR